MADSRGGGVESPVASPTYNLVLHYSRRRPFTHVDLYVRFKFADAFLAKADKLIARHLRGPAIYWLRAAWLAVK